MKPEKQNLIRDLLGADSRREETFLAGARLLRRRRRWRAAQQGAALAVVVIVATMLLVRHETQRSVSTKAAKMVPKRRTPTQVEALTDDQLLALFPKTPVALASLPDGKKKLIFPRPGDEQRFIKRL